MALKRTKITTIGTAILTALLEEPEPLAVLFGGPGLYLKSCCSRGSAKPPAGITWVALPSALR